MLLKAKLFSVITKRKEKNPEQNKSELFSYNMCRNASLFNIQRRRFYTWCVTSCTPCCHIHRMFLSGHISFRKGAVNRKMVNAPAAAAEALLDASASQRQPGKNCTRNEQWRFTEVRKPEPVNQEMVARFFFFFFLFGGHHIFFSWTVIVMTARDRGEEAICLSGKWWMPRSVKILFFPSRTSVTV